MTSAAAVASSLGMNDKVISLICVEDWHTPNIRPTSSAVKSSGADSISVISSARCATVMTVSGVIVNLRSSVEAGGDRSHDERPAVDQNEQHDLERKRDQDRREHHHS